MTLTFFSVAHNSSTLFIYIFICFCQQNMDEIDEYCKKHSISSYAYIKTTSPTYTSQIFSTFTNSASNPTGDVNSTNVNANSNLKSNQSSGDLLESGSNGLSLVSSSMSSSNNNSNNISNYSILKIKSIVEKSSKYLEKKFNLQEFLANTNIVISNLTSSFNSLNFNPTQSLFFNTLSNAQNTPIQSSSGYMNSLSGTNLNNMTSSNPNTSQTGHFTSYLDFIDSRLNSVAPSSMSFASTPIAIQNTNSSNTQSSANLNVLSQLNVTILLEPSSKQQSMVGASRKKLENQIVSKIIHVFALFNTRVRIELLIIETPDNVIQALANGLHLEMDEQYFTANWVQCLEKLNNLKVLRELRYVKKSKVFILYSLKSEQFKLIVVP